MAISELLVALHKRAVSSSLQLRMRCPSALNCAPDTWATPWNRSSPMDSWLTCLPEYLGPIFGGGPSSSYFGPGLAYRVQPDLPRRTLPQRRHRWLRSSGHLAHLWHPRDRPDAKKVEHLQSTLTRRHSETR